MLPLDRLSAGADASALFQTAPISMTTDWSGSPLGYGCDFYLAISNHDLYYGARVEKKPLLPPAPADQSPFVEGLWEYDVIELFLKDDTSPHYREFNLSPDGRWWTCLFDDYRRRRANSRLLFETPEIVHEIGAEQFQVAMRIPRNTLQLLVSFAGPSSAHLAAIFGGPQRQFISTGAVPGINPDFHHRDCFQRFASPRQAHV